MSAAAYNSISMIDKVELGRRFHELRIAYGETSTHNKHLLRIEHAECVPSLRYVEEFAESHGVTIGYLLAGVDQRTASGSFIVTDSFCEEIAKVVKQLSVWNKKIILEVLRDLNWKAADRKTKNGRR